LKKRKTMGLINIMNIQSITQLLPILNNKTL